MIQSYGGTIGHMFKFFAKIVQTYPDATAYYRWLDDWIAEGKSELKQIYLFYSYSMNALVRLDN